MVKCVLISEEEGSLSEIETPLQSDLYRILKGPGTFIGQWPALDVVIMKCSESCFDLMENRNVLPRPYHKEHVVGPILLIRMDADAEPQDFTLDEYTKWAKTWNPS